MCIVPCCLAASRRFSSPLATSRRLTSVSSVPGRRSIPPGRVRSSAPAAGQAAPPRLAAAPVADSRRCAPRTAAPRRRRPTPPPPAQARSRSPAGGAAVPTSGSSCSRPSSWCRTWASRSHVTRRTTACRRRASSSRFSPRCRSREVRPPGAVSCNDTTATRLYSSVYFNS